MPQYNCPVCEVIIRERWRKRGCFSGRGKESLKNLWHWGRMRSARLPGLTAFPPESTPMNELPLVCFKILYFIDSISFMFNDFTCMSVQKTLSAFRGQVTWEIKVLLIVVCDNHVKHVCNFLQNRMIFAPNITAYINTMFKILSFI